RNPRPISRGGYEGVVPLEEDSVLDDAEHDREQEDGHDGDLDGGGSVFPTELAVPTLPQAFSHRESSSHLHRLLGSKVVPVPGRLVGPSLPRGHPSEERAAGETPAEVLRHVRVDRAEG